MSRTNKTTRNHVVQAAYLKKFLNNADKLFEWDKSLCLTYPGGKPAKDTGFIKRFYPQEVEDAYAQKVEGPHFKVIEGILTYRMQNKKSYSLKTNNTINRLLKYMACQEYRTNKYFKGYLKLSEELLQQNIPDLLDERFPNLGETERQEVEERLRDIKNTETKNTLKNIYWPSILNDTSLLKPDKEDLTIPGLDFHKDFIKVFRRFYWTLIKIPYSEDFNFITCDHPISLLDGAIREDSYKFPVHIP
jgi:hypothetical protein